MSKGTFVYFAYGSNMLSARLRKRCVSAQPMGTATAQGYSLGFSKRSIDGSGKATLIAQNGSEQKTHGALFEIAIEQRDSLDRAEGSGYVRRDAFPVFYVQEARELRVTSYVAAPDATDNGLIPYDWYRALVQAGAIEHGLPDSYIDEVARFEVRADPKPQRPSRQAALKVLSSLGFESLVLSPLERRP